MSKSITKSIAGQTRTVDPETGLTIGAVRPGRPNVGPAIGPPAKAAGVAQGRPQAIARELNGRFLSRINNRESGDSRGNGQTMSQAYDSTATPSGLIAKVHRNGIAWGRGSKY